MKKYILEIGVYDMHVDIAITRKIKRNFTSLAEREYDEEGIQKALKLMVYGWKEKLLQGWISTPEEPKTFRLDDFYGYRITLKPE